MRLKVAHRTAYRYARPVRLAPHRLLLFPRGGHELKPLSRKLDIAPAASLSWGQDVSGNIIATASFTEASDRLVIDSHVEVEQCAADWPVFAIAPSAHAFPFAYSDAEAADLGILLRACDEDQARLRAWTGRFVADAPVDTLSLLKAITAAVHAEIFYRRRDEEGTQTAAETLALGSGSCRDMATLLVEAARSLGFGARAVSGYLYSPPADGAAEGDAAQHGATHAWADIYLPGAGWIAFDPTNDRTGGAHLIPVAVARSIRDIMPVSGSYVGDPADFLDMEVDVRVTQSAALVLPERS